MRKEMSQWGLSALAALTVITALALGLTACADVSVEEAEAVSFTGVDGEGNSYTLTVGESAAKAAYAPKSGDRYTLVVTLKTGGTKTSTGTVSVSGSTFTLKASGGGTCVITVSVTSEGGITTITGTITFDGGGEMEGPGEVCRVTGVAISPLEATVAVGGAAFFAAKVTGTGEVAQEVLWSIDEEKRNEATAISSDGVLKVAQDETLASLTVRATSTVDPRQFATAKVTVRAVDGAVSSVVVEPEAATVERGKSLDFTALVDGVPSTAVTWAIATSGKAAGTSIDSSGRLTVSPAEKLSALVVNATSTANPAVSGTARVKITDEPATVTGVTVIPATAKVARGGEGITFSAKVEGTGNLDQAVIWEILETGRKAATTIDASGYLCVAVDEELSSLTVRAASALDSKIYAEAAVVITDGVQ